MCQPNVPHRVIVMVKQNNYHDELFGTKPQIIIDKKANFDVTDKSRFMHKQAFFADTNCLTEECTTASLSSRDWIPLL